MYSAFRDGLLAGLSLFVFGSVAIAQGMNGAPIDPEPGRQRPPDTQSPKNTVSRILYSVPGNDNVNSSLEVRFEVTKNREPSNLVVLRSSGVPEFDFNGICAVLSRAPIEETDLSKQLFFIPGNGQIATNDEVRLLNTKARKEFRVKTGRDVDQYFVCNIIPIEVLYRYPNVLTTADVCSINNLRAIPKTFFEKHNEPTSVDIIGNKQLNLFYKRWADFYRTHETTTADELKKFRDDVEQELGSMFVESNTISQP